jgi:membrane fusion protein (multidrug efflux system)
VHRPFVSGAIGAFVVLVASCSAPDATAKPQSAGDAKQAPEPKGGSAAQPPTRDGEVPRGADAKARGGRGGRGGGARSASIILGASDIYRVTRGPIEAGLPIAGDLRPIETVTVRSRIDGVLENVAVREGQSVRAGALLAQFESTEQESALRSAEADRLAAKGDFDTQKWNYEQSQELFKVGAIAERDLRSAQQTADAAQARLAATEAKWRSAANIVRDTKVIAPFNGTIEKRKVQNGENTARGAEMFTLVRSEVLELTATVPARRASEVKPGLPVRFMADARQFNGRVARVSPTIDPASRSITVYVQIPNSRGDLKGNAFATGQIIARTVEGALVVPQSAIRTSTDGGKPYVYRVEGGQLSVAPVQLGIVDEVRSVVEVTEGVKERDEIVVGTPGTMGPGMKVQVIGNEGRGGRGQKSAP